MCWETQVPEAARPVVPHRAQVEAEVEQVLAMAARVACRMGHRAAGEAGLRLATVGVAAVEPGTRVTTGEEVRAVLERMVVEGTQATVGHRA